MKSYTLVGSFLATVILVTGCSNLGALYGSIPFLPAAKATYCATQDMSIRKNIREKYDIPLVVDCGVYSIIFDRETGEEVIVVNE